MGCRRRPKPFTDRYLAALKPAPKPSREQLSARAISRTPRPSASRRRISSASTEEIPQVDQ